jgi:DNA (cytosine-5)-methyltransferase 1
MESWGGVPALQARDYKGIGNQPQGLVEICAMRGRNPDNPSDRTTGSPTQQRIEVNTTGNTNTLTSVQKDNLLICPK